ncbi:UNVERIFIED_CONTAM: hypothetical protein FKN15_052661 [Acipenser sinensis]
MSISGHRSETFLQSYWAPALENKKRWSNILSGEHSTALPNKQTRLDESKTSACALTPPSAAIDSYFNNYAIRCNIQMNVYEDN